MFTGVHCLPLITFFFFLNLMSIFFYTGAVVEIIHFGLVKKKTKHLGRVDYKAVLETGTAAWLPLTNYKLLLFVPLPQVCYSLPLSPYIFSPFAVF